MFILQRVFYIIVAIYCFTATDTIAQTQKSLNDSTFSAYMDSASVDLNKHNYADSLQKTYSDKFYNYYRDNPDSETGKLALERAFFMWGNLGDYDSYKNVVENLSYDSEIWNIAMLTGHNVYYLADGKSIEDFVKFVLKIKDKLSHPESKSQALYYLARYYNKEGKTDKMIEMAREIIEINANEFFVDTALGFQLEAEKLSIGSSAPDFKAQTIQGQTLSLSEQRGKVVILEFWATWCGPCMPDIPHLKSLRSKYSEDELKIIGVSLDTDTEKLSSFIVKEEMDWAQIIQPNQYDDEITSKYNVYIIPRSFIIGRDGKIVAKNLREEKLENEIAKLVQQ